MGFTESIFGAIAAMGPCLMFGLFAAVAAVAIVLGIIQARKRREAISRLAAEWGFEFYEDDPWNLPARYSHFDLFDSGHSKRVTNVLAGRVDGRTAILFDYCYKTGSGKNQTTHYYQAAVLEMPIVAARLQMRRENLLDKMASWIGHDDINFESDEFSRRYHVKCDDRKFAYDFFHTRLIEYLLGCGELPGVEMAGTVLLLYDLGRGDVANFRRLLDIGRAIVGSIPGYVLSARGVRTEAGGRP